MTTSSAEQLLKDMGIDPEEAVENWIVTQRRKLTVRDVCACGHPVGRHYIDGESVSCRPNAMDCSCSEYLATLKVSDLRPFLQKSTGSGIDHALVKGLTSANQKGVTVEWIGTATDCKKCGAKEGTTIYLLAGSESSGLQITDDPLWGRWNYFLCQTCANTV